MEELYFISQLSRRMREKVPEIPSIDFLWSRDYTGNYLKDEFWSVVCEFRNIMINILNDIQRNPTAWNVVCNPIVELPINAPRLPEETRASKELLRIGDMFQAFSVIGELHNSYLSINRKLFMEQKIPKVNSLMKQITEFGFVITDFKTKSSEFLIEYPDNDAVLQVIKAYSLIPNINKLGLSTLILRAEWRYFCEDKGLKFQYDMSDMYRGLSDFNTSIVSMADEILNKYGYTCSVNDTGGYQIDTKHKKDKKRLFFMKRERDDIVCRFRLDNIRKYISVLEGASANIINSVLNSVDCSHCKSWGCNGIPFHYQGKDYDKCVMFNFYFKQISESDVSYLMNLLEMEIKYRLEVIA